MNSDAGSSTSIRILLVEDHIDTLTSFAKILRAGGYTVHTADGYQAAIDIAQKEKLDLAICDIGLWDGNGCELLEDLQRIQNVKAIAVTGLTLNEEVQEYHAAGFAAVFQKPVDAGEITLAISRLTNS